MNKQTMIYFVAADIALAMVALVAGWKWILIASICAAVVNAVRAIDARLILAYALIGVGHAICTINNGLADVAETLKWVAIKCANGAGKLSGTDYNVNVTERSE